MSKWGLSCRVYLEPRDLWVGVYWDYPKRVYVEDGEALDPIENRVYVHICLLPCIPIRLIFWRHLK